MDLAATTALAAAGVALCLVSRWGDAARRRAPLERDAHLPWHGLMFVGLTVAAVGAAHLLTLLKG